MSNNWYRPPPAPLDLPTPTYDDRPRSFPDFPAPDLFPLQLPVVQHSPLASPSAGGLSPPDSPGPPLKGLATKFAQMMGRGTSPVPPTSSSSSVGGVAIEPPLAPPAAPVDRPGHGYSKSVGQPASAFWDQLDERGLSGDEIERLAREERDWSRREAERLMALENQRLATGKRSATMATTPEAEDQTPRKVVAARSNSYFDASSTPPGASTASRTAAPAKPIATSSSAPVSSPSVARPISQTPSLPELPAQKSSYLLPHPSDPEALDVPASLVLLARKFEKLEVYAVTHLRSLSSRMIELEGRVSTLEDREGDAVGSIRKEMRELRLAMADGFRALEGEIEDILRRERDGFGLGMGIVEPRTALGVQERRQLTNEPEPMVLPTPLSSSASSSSSSHARSPMTPSPNLTADAFPVDTTPLAVSQPAASSSMLASGSLESPSMPIPKAHSASPGGSPVPPRKRYTALLSSRSDTDPSPSPAVVVNDDDLTHAAPPSESIPRGPSRSTPLPSAPFPPGRSQTAFSVAALSPSSTQPLFVKSRLPTPAPPPNSTATATASEVDSPTRRRARSVGSSTHATSARPKSEADLSNAAAILAHERRVLREDVKASNRGRAPVNKLISAWERE